MGKKRYRSKCTTSLKRTLGVITTDLAFLVKDEETSESLYVGKPDAQNDVWIAPSTFAAVIVKYLHSIYCNISGAPLLYWQK